MTENSPPLIDTIGGLPGVETILADFYDRVFADAMIGFMFQGLDKQRLIEKEAEMSARILGAKDIKYTGLPLRGVHARHRVMGGQFARRLQILKDTLRDHNVPQAVFDAWILHNEKLRPQITNDPSTHCGEGDDELA